MRRIQLLPLLISLLVLSLAGRPVLGGEKPDNQTALLLIDIQEFYFPGGSLPLTGPEAAAENARMILDLFRETGSPVIHVRHKAGSGAAIHARVKPVDGEKIVTKTEVNAFNGTDLLASLRALNVNKLVFCGMQTHMCLEAAVRAGHDFDFECFVIEDACATRDLKFGVRIVPAEDVHASTLATLSGTYARVLTTEEFLDFDQK